MSVIHRNRLGHTYHLHVSSTKTGGRKYYFAKASTGTLAESLPKGFEVYETPNGQVFLRRNVPQLVTAEEVDTIRRRLARIQGGSRYLTEIRGAALIIHEGTSKLGLLTELAPHLSPQNLEELSIRSIDYQAVMRFALTDRERRLFEPERFGFHGSVDDWIPIGPPDSIGKLADQYLKHLGKESFYELF